LCSESTRALIISGGRFAPGSVRVAHGGTSPQRIISTMRLPSWIETTGAGCVGATLNRGFHHSFAATDGSSEACSSSTTSSCEVSV
jgi:hypothetical protein